MTSKTLIFITIITVIVIYTKSTNACSCMLEHAQTKYCKSDYVIIARVLRKSVRKLNHNDVYKIEIKKAYKMSDNANQYLKEGRLMTPPSESTCGITLKVGKLYLIAGNNGRVGLCDYVKEYSKMTIVERRGFAGGYKKGCTCDINAMFRMAGYHHPIGACIWNPMSACESDFGACVPSRGLLTAEGKPTKCHWRQSPPYNACREQ